MSKFLSLLAINARTNRKYKNFEFNHGWIEKCVHLQGRALHQEISCLLLFSPPREKLIFSRRWKILTEKKEQESEAKCFHFRFLRTQPTTMEKLLLLSFRAVFFFFFVSRFFFRFPPAKEIKSMISLSNFFRGTKMRREDSKKWWQTPPTEPRIFLLQF